MKEIESLADKIVFSAKRVESKMFDENCKDLRQALVSAKILQANVKWIIDILEALNGE